MDLLRALGQVEAESSMNIWVIIGVVVAILVVVALVVVFRRKPALPAETEGSKKALEGVSPQEYEKKKDSLSLAELKASKKLELSQDTSKEELRELRRERRASEQTEKAQAQESKDEGLKITDAVTDSSVGAGDVFASLFGDAKKSGLMDMDDDIEGVSPGDSVIPTLGSGLIRLDGSKPSAKGDNSLDELTKRLAEKARAEKKTMN